MRKGKIKIIAGVLMFGLLVSGCQSTGGDKAAETTVTETPKVTETATPTPEVKETATPTPEPTKEEDPVKAEEVKDDASDQKDDEQTKEDQDNSQETKDNKDNKKSDDNEETEDGGNKAVVQVWEDGRYIDERFTDPDFEDTACQIEVSNVTDTSFDFTIYDVRGGEEEVIFNTNTATFLPGGEEAVFKGKEYTLHFTFPDYHHAYPYATDMEVTGFAPLEGHSYANGSIPGHEFG
ncbi:MAG: hypothetical protein PHS82_08775 [Lachnospiraceae bacterium]|nr:hypothetical protein [Lachnospiraceae bacterium]